MNKTKKILIIVGSVFLVIIVIFAIYIGSIMKIAKNQIDGVIDTQKTQRFTSTVKLAIKTIAIKVSLETIEEKDLNKKLNPTIFLGDGYEVLSEIVIHSLDPITISVKGSNLDGNYGNCSSVNSTFENPNVTCLK